MRVLFATERFIPEPLGGSERSALSISRFLAKRGHEVTVLTRRFSDAVPAEEHVDGLHILRYTPRPVPDRLWMFHRTLARRGAMPLLRGRRGRHDVAIAYPPYVQQLARLDPSMPQLYRAGGTIRGARRWEQPPFQGRTRRMRLWNALAWRRICRDERGSIGAADRIVTPSRNIKHQLLHYYHVPDQRVRVIHNGVDTDWLTPPAEPPADGPFRIVSVGRLDAVKNHRLLLAGLARARHRRTMRLRLVGDGSLREDLRQQVCRLGLSDLVELAGHDDDVPRHYRWACLFVLPSVYEGIGSSVLEAMSCGLPCVALRPKPPEIWTAGDELIEDGVTGVLLDGNDPSALAEVLDSLCEDRALCRRMGRAGRRRVEREFTWDRAAERYEQLLEQLVANGSGR